MINRDTLVSSLAAQTGSTQTEAAANLSSVLKAITTALKTDGEIKLVGFGNFKVKDRPARQGRNPHTGATIQIAASQAVTFKASKTLLG